MIFILFFSLFICTWSAKAQCPVDQSTFSMVYPPKIIFLSEDITSKSPQDVPFEIAKAILNEFADSSPKILFVGTKNTFSAIKSNLTKYLDASLVDKKLILYETLPAQFQQDVFETFYQDQDKSIIIRQFQGYTPKNKGPSLDKLFKILAIENIKMKLGDPISQYDAWITGVGGNVESTSFGWNLLGSGEFSKKNAKSFAANLFPRSKSTLILDTSWLALGHIDEVLVEIKSKKESGACESTILINSPKLGIQYEEKVDKDTRTVNLEAQKNFEKYKSELVHATKEICKINFIEVPIIYKNIRNTFKRSVLATAYPSLTNGLIIKDRYFVVEVENKEIRKSFENSLTQIGIKVVWVPILKNLFTDGLVDGFLHCLTNSIRVCE